MNDAHKSALCTVAAVLFRCWIAGFVLLFVTFGIVMIGEPVHKLHGALFGLTPHELDIVFYCWLGTLKIVVLTLFFIPWLSIRLLLKTSATSIGNVAAEK